MLANKGPLTGPAALKGAHFIRLCTLRGVPLVFLQNTPSDREFLSPSGNDGETVKARARMMATLACSHVPKITVAMGNSYGPSSYAMVSSIICVSVYVLCKCGYQWLVPPLLVLHDTLPPSSVWSLHATKLPLFMASLSHGCCRSTPHYGGTRSTGRQTQL